MFAGTSASQPPLCSAALGADGSIINLVPVVSWGVLRIFVEIKGKEDFFDG